MTLSFLIGIFAFTACQNKNSTKLAKNDITKIQSDTDWFEYNEKELSIDKYSHFEINSRVIKTDDGYVAACNGVYSDDASNTGLYVTIDMQHEDGIIEVDFDGSIKDYTVITPEMIGVDSKYSCIINQICLYNGDILCFVDCVYIDEESYKVDETYVFYDFTKGRVEDISYITGKLGKNSTLGYVTYTDNGYLIAAESDKDSNTNLHVAKNGELLEVLDANKLIPNFFEVKNVYSNDDIVTVECINMFNMYVNLNIDTNTMLNTVEETGKLASIDFADNWKTDYYDDNGDLLRPDSDGIYKGDELVCDFSSSYGNPALLKSGCIIDASDDRYVMIVRYLDTHQVKLFFISFDKAVENPNEGKTMLTAGFTGDIDFAIGTAISKYNKTNSDYFVLAKSYKLESEDILEIDSENERTGSVAIITNNLMMDMLNGDGPDILINTADYSQFNNDKYLVDLSSFVSEEIPKGVLFDNVINSSKTNDKLYQIPISFSVNGIIMDASDSNGKTGFTFDEFKTYVNNSCNGTNPIAPFGGRIEAFDTLYCMMSELMYDDNGDINMGNGVFEDIASYCNENIVKDKDEHDPLFFLDGSEIKLNSYITLNDIKYYLYSNPMMNDIAFKGLPSTDGRGPSITAGGSVAISKACCDLDGGKAFIKFFLTNESIYEHVSENPILISACRNNSIDIINLFNSNYDEQSKYTSEAELNSYGLYHYDLVDADKYIDILKTADCNTSVDANVMIIINEEIQAYFAGQKSIDSVIKIIQDRAQTVIDER